MLQIVKRKENNVWALRPIGEGSLLEKKDEKTQKKNGKFLLQREERLNPEGFFFPASFIDRPCHCSQKTKKKLGKTSIVFCVFRAKPNKSQKMVTKSRNF